MSTKIGMKKIDCKYLGNACSTSGVMEDPIATPRKVRMKMLNTPISSRGCRQSAAIRHPAIGPSRSGRGIPNNRKATEPREAATKAILRF